MMPEIRTVGQARALFIHHFHLIALEDRDVGKLSKPVNASMLDHQQAGFDVFQNKTETGNHSRRSPHIQFISFMPDTEMNSRPLNCWREFGKDMGIQREPMLEH